MANIIVTSNLTTGQVLSTSDKFSLLEGVSVTNASGTAISLTGSSAFDIDLIIRGQIVGSSLGVNLSGDSNGDGTGFGSYDVFVGATGSISALDGNALSVKGRSNIVTNYGEIAAVNSSDSAVYSLGDDLTLRNYGTLIGGKGVTLSAVSGSVFNAEVENHGNIQGESFGISSSVLLNLNNTGTIVSSDDDANSMGISVSLFDLPVDGIGSVINNSGLISGQGTAIRFYQLDNVVQNSGHINGDVIFGSGADLFDGRGGTVDGTVFGGTGDDIYIIDDATIDLFEAASEGTDEVQTTVGYKLADNFENLTLIGSNDIRGVGNNGANTINGNIGDNRLQGKNGNDLINGGEGVDTIIGGAGADTLYGDDGDDSLFGRSGNDKLYGGNGGDLLKGGRGNDVLRGKNGDDVLVGGFGKDILYGGDGADSFVFNRENDSPNSANFDIIKDFVQGDDIIDLSGITGSLDFIGSSSFSGTTAEVRISVSGGTDTMVRIDLDGDGSLDMKILVEGTISLNVTDFIL